MRGLIGFVLPNRKKGIRDSNLDDPSNYLRRIHDKFLHDTVKHWLKKSGKDSKLCELLLEHGLRFDGSLEIGYTGSSVIVENHRHYLLTGKSVDSIEDLIIGFTFSTVTIRILKEKNLKGKWNNGNIAGITPRNRTYRVIRGGV